MPPIKCVHELEKVEDCGGLDGARIGFRRESPTVLTSAPPYTQPAKQTAERNRRQPGQEFSHPYRHAEKVRDCRSDEMTGDQWRSHPLKWLQVSLQGYPPCLICRRAPVGPRHPLISRSEGKQALLSKSSTATFE
ncbi:hypothetical protein D9C73_023812 [Collichthys lucidus]|uniref:Uncharacterized protein n=1 Tax=Collichthys lucidus TaxID=240159 RepID=A0A4U5VMH0_COLLU|nr:hypothetical protein D9C73_023812 [Collichthys lucidus]